jgi:hypothetical protein
LSFYILRQSTQETLGPYSLEQIQGYLDQGLLSSEDHAAPVGSPNWMAITKVTGLVFSRGNDLVRGQVHEAHASSSQRPHSAGRSRGTIISFEKAIQVPVGLMMVISLSAITVAGLLFYALVDFSPLVLGFAFILISTLGVIALTLVRKKLCDDRAKLLRRMKNEYTDRFGSGITWEDAIGGFLEGGGEGWAEESMKEFDLVGVALGKAASFLGKAISNTPQNREREVFARRIQAVEKAIEKTDSNFVQAIILILFGCAVAMYAVVSFASLATGSTA